MKYRMRRAPRGGLVAGLSAALTTLILVPAQPADFDNTKARTAETAFGDLLTDALRAVAGADIAFLNGGALHEKKVSAAGNDTEALSDLLVYPTEKVAVLSLTGEQVIKALERGLSALPAPSNGFLQVSGLKVGFDPAAPGGRRVKSVLLVKSGAPVEPATKYRVATSLDLAKGGQGYFSVFGREALIETKEVTIQQTLEDYRAQSKSQSLPRLERLLPQGR